MSLYVAPVPLMFMVTTFVPRSSAIFDGVSRWKASPLFRFAGFYTFRSQHEAHLGGKPAVGPVTSLRFTVKIPDFWISLSITASAEFFYQGRRRRRTSHPKEYLIRDQVALQGSSPTSP